MKKLVTTVLTALFLSFALFAAGMNDTAVVRLHAYVPPSPPTSSASPSLPTPTTSPTASQKRE